MPKRTEVHASAEQTPGTLHREANDPDPQENRLGRRLGQIVMRGQASLWIWALVAAALVAMSVSTILTTARPKGIDFNWNG